MTVWRLPLLLAALSPLLPGCQLALGIEERELVAGAGGTAGSSGASGQECTGQANPGSSPRTMVRIKGPQGCTLIDLFEVSRADYQEFLDSAPSTLNQPSGCESNTFEKGPNCDDLSGLTDDDAEAENLPVACVDQCDAQAYCNWDGGKRLCRTTQPGAPSASEWYLACTNQETRSLPYEGSVQNGICNGSESAAECATNEGVACTTQPVGALPACVTPQGVLDLLGNVAEWTAECEGNGPSSNCVVRGGSYANAASEMSCASEEKIPRDMPNARIGFRCCASD